MKNISELLDSLSAKSAENGLNPTTTSTPVSKVTDPNGNSFGQVIAKMSDQQQNGNSTYPALVPPNNPSPTQVIESSAITPSGTNNQTPALSAGTTGTSEASRDTLLVSEQLQGVKPQDVASIEKTFFAMASGLANLLSQAQQLTGENSSQIQAQLVANSGGQITSAEAAQLVSAVLSFVQNLPQGQNPLDLDKQDQNQLMGQMLQQMLQNQQVAFALAPPTAIQTDNQSGAASQTVQGTSQSNALSNVTLRFMFTDAQITQTQTAGNQNSNLFVNVQSAQLSVFAQTFENQNAPTLNGAGTGIASAVVPNQPVLNSSANFQPIPQDKVNSILNALSQLGAQPGANLAVTIINPATSNQGSQDATSTQNLQALFKVLLQAGAGPVMLQSAVIQQGTTANNPNLQTSTATVNGNPFALLGANLNKSSQSVAIQPIQPTENSGNPNINPNPLPADQGQATANPVSSGNAKSFWSSVNFSKINDLILRFTAFIGQPTSTQAVTTPQGPAQIAVANSPSAITAQVGASVGPQASPVALSQLPDGDQQETVNNILTPGTVQLQPTLPPHASVNVLSQGETQDQTLLSQSQSENQGASTQVQGQSQASSTSVPVQTQTNISTQNTSLNPTGLNFTTLPVNNNLVSTTFTPTTNTITPSVGINPSTPTTPSGTAVLPGTQVATPSQQIISQANLAQVVQANAVAQSQNTLNQAANPGISTPPVSLAQNLAGSVAAVNVFNEGMAQNQSNPTQTPLVANPVLPSETVPSITPQAVTAVSTLGETEKVQSVSLQDKNSFADQLSTQNPTNPLASGVFYTLGKNGEVQAVNPAGNQIPVNAQDLISQISNQVSTKSGELKSVSTINFQLVPENLGRMTIQVSLVDQSVSARILVTNPDVKDALQQHLVDLKTSLNQAGLQIDQLQVQVQGGGASLLSQYYQFQQEGYGSSLPTFGSTETGNLSENEAVSGPLSVRKSLVNLLA